MNNENSTDVTVDKKIIISKVQAAKSIVANFLPLFSI